MKKPAKPISPKEKYAKRLRSQIMASAVNKGLDKEQLYSIMPSWGFSKTLTKYGIKDLLVILDCVNGNPPDADNPLNLVGFPPMAEPAQGMANQRQQYYACLLSNWYSILRKIPVDKRVSSFSGWLSKYAGISWVSFATSRQMHKIIHMLEREITTTFGDSALAKLRTMERGKDAKTA